MIWNTDTSRLGFSWFVIVPANVELTRTSFVSFAAWTIVASSAIRWNLKKPESAFLIVISQVSGGALKKESRKQLGCVLLFIFRFCALPHCRKWSNAVFLLVFFFLFSCLRLKANILVQVRLFCLIIIIIIVSFLFASWWRNAAVAFWFIFLFFSSLYSCHSWIS